MIINPGDVMAMKSNKLAIVESNLPVMLHTVKSFSFCFIFTSEGAV